LTGCGKRDEAYFRANPEMIKKVNEECNLRIMKALMAQKIAAVEVVKEDKECIAAEKVERDLEREESARRRAAQEEKEASERARLKSFSEEQLREQIDKNKMFSQERRRALDEVENRIEEYRAKLVSDPEKAKQVAFDCEKQAAGKPYAEKEKVNSTISCKAAAQAVREIEKEQARLRAAEKAEASRKKTEELMALPLDEFDNLLAGALQSNDFPRDEYDEASRRLIEIRVVELKPDPEATKRDIEVCAKKYKAYVTPLSRYERFWPDQTVRCQAAWEAGKVNLGLTSYPYVIR